MYRQWIQATPRHIPYEEGSVPIPNAVYDMGSEIEGNEIKLVMLILRHSLGEQQMYATLSIDEISAMTGIKSQPELEKCLQSCINKAYFKIDESQPSDKPTWLLGEVLFTGVDND